MVELHWPRRSTFLGPSQQYVGPGTFDVPDSEEERFRERGWEDPPADESGDADGSGDDEDGEDREGDEDEDVPLVDRDPGQLTETERRIDAADYQTLRQVAGQLDDIDGRGSEDELRVALHTDADDDRVDEAFAAVGSDEG